MSSRYEGGGDAVQANKMINETESNFLNYATEYSIHR